MFCFFANFFNAVIFLFIKDIWSNISVEGLPSLSTKISSSKLLLSSIPFSFSINLSIKFFLSLIFLGALFCKLGFLPCCTALSIAASLSKPNFFSK